MTEKIVVPIYAAKCSICTYMNPQAEKTFKCHYSNGNMLCPAEKYVFSVGFSAEVFAKKYVEAYIANDATEIIKIMEKLQQQPTNAAEQFWQRATEILVDSVEIVDEVENTGPGNAETETAETQAGEGTSAPAESSDWN